MRYSICLILCCLLLGCLDSSDKLKTTGAKASIDSLSNGVADSSTVFFSKKAGFLRIRADLLHLNLDSIIIRNLDNTFYAALAGAKTIEPYIKGPKDIDIEAYSPDYYIIIFKSDSLENGDYKVLINKQEKIIQHKDGITIYETLDEYIKKNIIITTSSNPLRKAPFLNAPEIKFRGTYENVSFEVEEVRGEWLKVKCLLDCEGCPYDKQISGWLKWRLGEDILVKIFYTC